MYLSTSRYMIHIIRIGIHIIIFVLYYYLLVYMHFYHLVTRPLTENTVENNITSSDVPNITAIYDDEYIEVFDKNGNDTITDDEYYYHYNTLGPEIDNFTTTKKPKYDHPTTTSSSSGEYSTENEFSTKLINENTPEFKTSTTTLTYDGDIVSETEKETSTLTYLGDVEDVEDHIKRLKLESNTPNLCAGHFDAVTSLRNELFIFKGQVCMY